jgi:putative flippase GtrA
VFNATFNDINKTDRHEITEILLKMALISITQKQTKCSIFTYIVVIDRQQGILITNTLSMVSCLELGLGLLCLTPLSMIFQTTIA